MNKSALKRLPKEKLLTLIDDLEIERDRLNEAIKRSVATDRDSPLSRTIAYSEWDKPRLLDRIADLEETVNSMGAECEKGASEKRALIAQVEHLQTALNAEKARADKNYQVAVDRTNQAEFFREARNKAIDALKSALQCIGNEKSQNDYLPLLKAIADALSRTW